MERKGRVKITYRGDYSLKTVLYLAVQYEKMLVTIHELAKKLDIPIKFLEQILLDLKRGGFVESRRGKAGGYILAKPPSQIKLGEVIRFFDGQIEPIACANLSKNYIGCNDIHKCTFRKIWREVTQATSDIIDNITFEDLIKQTIAQKESIIYQI